MKNQIPKATQQPGRKRSKVSLFAQGEPLVWLNGGGLAIALLMIAGLLVLVFANGVSTMWPSSVPRIETADGRLQMGEITRTETYNPDRLLVDRLPENIRSKAMTKLNDNDGIAQRRLMRIGNFEFTGEHFRWINSLEITQEDFPEWALTVERLEWGRFYGFPVRFITDGQVVADTPEQVWKHYLNHHDDVRKIWRQRRSLEKDDIGKINHGLEKARLDLKKAEIKFGKDSPQWKAQKQQSQNTEKSVMRQYEKIQQEIRKLNDLNSRYKIVMQTVDGKEKELRLSEIVRAYPANRLSFFEKTGVYLSRWKEFLTDEPREANSEGGVFPAIFGTIVMTLIMCIAVVPFGVIAALYLREYAKAGAVVSTVRIAINNLAGVPSIVFGVFGLGFFCYIVGASIDSLFFIEKLPNPTYGQGGILWASLTLALLTLPVVIVATEEALAAVPNSMREGSYACGGSKWQTIKRIVLPRAMPGIMTGMILAMARGAGEVAPLMLVGAVKLAPELPIDGIFPYIHPERSFMHLGFHIYDIGFQSQNSEAAKPMVFTTTLLLISFVFILNITATRLRTMMKKKFEGSVF